MNLFSQALCGSSDAEGKSSRSAYCRAFNEKLRSPKRGPTYSRKEGSKILFESAFLMAADVNYDALSKAK
jgi:hypothetical protein